MEDNIWSPAWGNTISKLIAPVENVAVISKVKLILHRGSLGTCCEIVLMWMPQKITNEKSTLVQVIAWCRQAKNHYLSQCWPRSMSPYGITRPQRVNTLRPEQNARHLQTTFNQVENFWGIVSPNDLQVQNIFSPVHILPVQNIGITPCKYFHSEPRCRINLFPHVLFHSLTDGLTVSTWLDISHDMFWKKKKFDSGFKGFCL